MIQSLKCHDKNFPELLREIQNPPQKLFIKGAVPNSKLTHISIVGTRKATREGIGIAHTFAKELAMNDCVIVSGLALGIDGSAHQGALDGGGTTIAVLANGIDSIYPRQHKNLSDQILANNGTIISEYEPGTPPYPNQFLERNRIVAGISQATIIIECPIRSGSMATARLAIESGRDVFVLPGPPTNKNYEGSHFLIRNGARLVTKPTDILEDLGIEYTKEKTKDGDELDDVSKRIISILKKSTEPVHVDTIIEMAHLEPDRVQEALTLLALDEIINDCGGSFTINE